MDKNYSVFFIAGLVLGVCIAAIFGYFIWGHQNSGEKGVINYSGSLSSTNLYNELASIVADLQGVRAPLAGMQTSSTASLSFSVALSPSSSTATTTQVAGLAGALGDVVLVESTASSTGFSWVANVQIASTTSATFQIIGTNATLGSFAPSTTTFNLTVLPRASFLVPAALVTTTSTSN